MSEPTQTPTAQPLLVGPIKIVETDGQALHLSADPSVIWVIGILGGWKDAEVLWHNIKAQLGDAIKVMVIPVAFIHDIYGLRIEDAKTWRDDHYRTMTQLINLAEQDERTLRERERKNKAAQG